MKIAICSTGDNLEAQVSPVFGRCSYFLIVDSKTKEFKAIANAAFESGRGAGVGASQAVTSEGVKAIVCGSFGPNAFAVLQTTGAKLYSAPFGLTVRQAVEYYNKGKLTEVKAPTEARFGFGRGFGRGLGRGFGRGLGRGKRGW